MKLRTMQRRDIHYRVRLKCTLCVPRSSSFILFYILYQCKYLLCARNRAKHTCHWRFCFYLFNLLLSLHERYNYCSFLLIFFLFSFPAKRTNAQSDCLQWSKYINFAIFITCCTKCTQRFKIELFSQKGVTNLIYYITCRVPTNKSTKIVHFSNDIKKSK